MDDGRSVLIPSFLFFVLSLPDPLRFRNAGLFGIRLLCQFPGFPCQFSDFPSLFSDFCVRFRAFPVRIRFCGVLVRLFRCRSPAAGAFSPFSGICFLPPRFCRPVSAAPFLPPRSCRPFLPPGLPFYLFAALSVRNRRWILPMRRSSEDCPAMPVQYVDTHCIYSCIAAVWAGCVSDCVGSSMLPNC